MPTPPLIAALAARYGAYLAMMKLGTSSRLIRGVSPDTWKEDVVKDLDDLADDKLSAQVPVTTVTGEVIDLGSGSTTSEHKLLCGRRTVNPGSLIVTDADGSPTYINGTDYYIYYNEDYQCTMLVAVHASIVDGALLTYDYSHLKRRELDLPPGHDTVVLVRS